MREYKKPVVEVVELTFRGSIAITPGNVISGTGVSNGGSKIDLFANEPNGLSTSGNNGVETEQL